MNKDSKLLDGFSGEDLFNIPMGITYKDYLILPGFIDFNPNDVNLETYFSRDIKLKKPFVSSPMDTVTESSMAIAMALMGGMGVIHYNNTIEEQAKEVYKVKRYENGFISEPVLLSPNHTILDILSIKEKLGFSGIPITEDGTKNTKLVGIVTNRDIDFEPDQTTLLGKVMTTNLIIGNEGITLKEANQIIKTKKIGKLPIINKSGLLVSLVSRSDLKKNKDFPDASKDEFNRLRVAAAISTLPESRDRLKELVKNGVDVIIIDSAQGNSSYQIDLIKFIKKEYNGLNVIGGNVVTRAQAENLIQAGADGLRIGMGPGSICITQDTMAVGRAQATAVYYTAKIASTYGIPVIADGGLTNIGDMANALSVGASTCMMGFMFAGTSEAPGEYFYENGVRLKRYRGMASLEAMEAGGGKRYFNEGLKVKVAQGVSGSVLDRGSILNFIPYLAQGLKLSFQDMGHKSILDLHSSLRNGSLRFERRTLSAQQQGSAHSLHSYQSPSNRSD